MRKAVELGGGEADLLHELDGSITARGGRTDVVQCECMADDRAYTLARIQAGEWILEDDLHSTAQGTHVCHLQAQNVVPVKGDLAVRRFQQSQD